MTPLPRSTAPVFMKKERLIFTPPHLPTAIPSFPTSYCYLPGPPTAICVLKTAIFNYETGQNPHPYCLLYVGPHPPTAIYPTSPTQNGHELSH